jgi:hypothetical protein
MRVKTGNAGPHLLVMYFLSWRNICGHYNIGSRWLRWVIKQRGVIQALKSQGEEVHCSENIVQRENKQYSEK